MDTLEAIQARRAVKHFDPDHVISEETTRTLLQTTMLSPTAFNLQHWRLVVVKDAALRQQIRQVGWNQAQMTEASLLIILCADLMAWAKNPGQYWQHTDAAVQSFLVEAITNYYQGKPQVARDECMRSCGIAAQTLMLTAKSLGYDSCPMDGFDFDAVGRLIHLPENHVIALMVAIGKSKKDPWPRGSMLPYDQVVRIDSF